MEQWSGNVWTAIIAAFVVGLILGYVIFRATNANAQKQQKLEKDLKAATTKIDEQKQQLEKHFEQSASLLATLAEDYKKLYSHLAKGSQTLL
ncbi:YhcB family protein, partial [Glaesserella sp.]